ncbi:MAG: hypothetical protein EBT13_17670, partial [Rhodobacteraceae bacterium]|nr:hypothetical protein [Paracoccaceae bacterium]
MSEVQEANPADGVQDIPVNEQAPVTQDAGAEAEDGLIQPVLEQAVTRMQNIILLGRQKREQVKIKTKIPLSRLTIIHESQD